MNLKPILKVLVTYVILKIKSISLFINVIRVVGLAILSLIILENERFKLLKQIDI